MALELDKLVSLRRFMTETFLFRFLRTSPEVICVAVMMYIRFPLSFGNVDDLLHERGIDVSYGSVRFWWHRFGPKFARSGHNLCSTIRTGSSTRNRCS
jgi:transposase-like protein